MKYLIVIVITFITSFALGDIIKSNTSHQQDIGQVKKVSKIRYFFVGYVIWTKDKHAEGNLQWFCYDGLMPVKDEVCKFLQKDMPDLKFTCNQLVIVGLHEFKNKAECDQFYNNQKASNENKPQARCTPA